MLNLFFILREAYLELQVVQYCIEHYCHPAASEALLAVDLADRSNSHVDDEHAVLVQYNVLIQGSSEKENVFICK